MNSDPSKVKVVLNKLSHLFSNDTAPDRTLSTSSNESSSGFTVSTTDSQSRGHRKQLHQFTDNAGMKIPPFSPTYCKDNEFPYSNFYVKLPDGRWMIKYRSGNRDSLGTDIFEGYMI